MADSSLALDKSRVTTGRNVDRESQSIHPDSLSRSLSMPTEPSYGEGRQSLVDAAIAVVAEAGLRNLTYRAVARRAGVSHALVAHHFGSRDSLIEAAVERALERSLEEAPLEDTGGLSQWGQSLARSVATNPGLHAFQFEMALEARRNPDIAPHVERLYKAYREATARELKRHGINDPAVTHLAFAALDGMVFQQVVLGRESRTREGVRALRRLLAREAQE